MPGLRARDSDNLIFDGVARVFTSGESDKLVHVTLATNQGGL